MSVHESGEMYLEAILVLGKRSGFVRSVDVSAYLGYSKPSVSRAVGILRKEGYEVSTGQFMKVSVPYTLTAVITGYILVWILFA